MYLHKCNSAKVVVMMRKRVEHCLMSISKYLDILYQNVSILFDKEIFVLIQILVDNRDLIENKAISMMRGKSLPPELI